MKTKEELASLKEEVRTMKIKLAGLTDEELEAVTGGSTMLSESDIIRQYQQKLWQTAGSPLSENSDRQPAAGEGIIKMPSDFGWPFFD